MGNRLLGLYKEISFLLTHSPKRLASFTRVSTRFAKCCNLPTTQNTIKKAIDLDEERLQTLRQRRASNVIFSPKEDMEEARRMVRLESFLVGLENFFAEPE